MNFGIEKAFDFLFFLSENVLLNQKKDKKLIPENSENVKQYRLMEPADNQSEKNVFIMFS